MVTPTVTQVLSWTPDSLRALGSEWATAAATAGNRIAGAGDVTTDSYTYWGPGAGDAMRDHVHEIVHAGKKLATALSDGHAALDTHRSRLQDTVDTALTAIRAATSSGFTVADDGTVTPPPVSGDSNPTTTNASVRSSRRFSSPPPNSTPSRGDTVDTVPPAAMNYLSTTSGFGQLGPVETTRLFSVLDSDPRAGAVISGHALAAADEIDRAFARSDREPPPIMLGETSGRLRAAVEGGLDIEIGDRVNDIDERKAERATMRAGFFGAAQAIGAGALSYLPPPWGVAASTGTYAVGAFLASDIIDADGNLTDAYTQSPQARFRLGAGDPDTPDQTQVTDNEIGHSMFAELVETGRIPVTSVSEYVRNDGGTITYADLIDTESTSGDGSAPGAGENRLDLIERLPEYFVSAGLRSTEGYLHQHSIAVGAYHNMIFGRMNGDGTFDAAIRGSGSPTAMSRWPV